MCTCPHALQPFFPLLSITFIIIPTLQLLLKYCWRAMKKPRTHGMSNPSQGTKWPKAERCVPGNRGQASVRDTCPMVWASCPSSEYCQTLGLSSFFFDFWDLLMSFLATKKQNLKLLFSLCAENANQPTQTASQAVLTSRKPNDFFRPHSQPSYLKPRRKLLSQRKSSYSAWAPSQIWLSKIRISFSNWKRTGPHT